MGDNTAISWAEATWNPTVGCTHVSPGCDSCYAEGMAVRIQAMGGKGAEAYEGTTTENGKWSGQINCLPGRLDQPAHWRKPRMIFVDSMSDLFAHGVPDEFVSKVFESMFMADHHTYQVLTKRPQRMRTWVNNMLQPALSDWMLNNIWLGTSIESDRYTFRADHLRETRGVIRWLSLEPLLGPLPSLDLDGIDWVVVGGESIGPRPGRPMDLGWVRDIRDQCVDAGVAFHVKQLHVDGRLVKNVDMFPDDLQIQQWPEVETTEPAGAGK